MIIKNFKFPLFQMIDSTIPIEQSNFFLQHLIDQTLICVQNNLEIDKNIQKILDKEFSSIYSKTKNEEIISDYDKDIYEKIFLIFQLDEINKNLINKKIGKNRVSTKK